MIMTRLCDLKGSGAQPARCPRRTLLAMSLTCSEPTNLCQSLFLSHSLTHWFSHPFPCTRSLFLSAVSICFAGHFCLQSISPCLPFFFLIFFHLPFAFIFCPSFSSLPSLSLTGPCMHNQTVVFIGNYCNYTIDKQVLVAFIHAPSQPASQAALLSLSPSWVVVHSAHHSPYTSTWTGDESDSKQRVQDGCTRLALPLPLSLSSFTCHFESKFIGASL